MEGVGAFRGSDFRVLDELYRNSNGAVFRALHKTTGCTCVLKQRKCPELGARKDMLNEVTLLGSLSHDNVIKCYGYFWDDSKTTLSMVLEYADGGDLYRYLLARRGRMRYICEQTLWKLYLDLARGVFHMHERGIIHRDIKSLNIMLTKQGQIAKIGDLGVSRQVSEDTQLLHTFYGTPLYVSPEMCDNRPYTEKTDIWSLGVVFYEMAQLQVPFQARNMIALAREIKRGEYAPLPSMYSSRVRDLVRWMLQVEPSDRPSIAQIVQQLTLPAEALSALADARTAVLSQDKCGTTPNTPEQRPESKPRAEEMSKQTPIPISETPDFMPVVAAGKFSERVQGKECAVRKGKVEDKCAFKPTEKSNTCKLEHKPLDRCTHSLDHKHTVDHSPEIPRENNREPFRPSDSKPKIDFKVEDFHAQEKIVERRKGMEEQKLEAELLRHNRTLKKIKESIQTLYSGIHNPSQEKITQLEAIITEIEAQLQVYRGYQVFPSETKPTATYKLPENGNADEERQFPSRTHPRVVAPQTRPQTAAPRKHPRTHQSTAARMPLQTDLQAHERLRFNIIKCAWEEV